MLIYTSLIYTYYLFINLYAGRFLSLMALD
jgi:hypothetical protein